MNIADALQSISKNISGESIQLDAQVLLAHILKEPRTYVAAHPEIQLAEPHLASINESISRLQAGEPLPYILGHWEFFGLDFELTPDVLIPRPETELLVERAIAWLKVSPERRTIADIGTGSGCISIAIAKTIPDAIVTATDISLPALKVARRNALKHGVTKRVSFVQCDLLPYHPDPLPTDLHFDLICANLPYIPTETLQGLEVYKHEPHLALDGGQDGLDAIRTLLEMAPRWLAPNGMILLEIEASQGLAVVSLAYDAFDNSEIYLRRDLSRRHRLVEILL